MLLPSLLLALTFLLSSPTVLSWVIPLENHAGILYRFTPASSNETEELLALAEVRQLYHLANFRRIEHSVSCVDGICGK